MLEEQADCKDVSSMPLLACAESNVAVDQLAIGLLKRGIKVVRVGTTSRASDEVHGALLQTRVQEHHDWSRLEQEKANLEDEFEDLDHKESNGQIIMSKRREVRGALNDRKRALRDAEKALARYVIRSCDVLCTTLVGAGAPDLSGLKFPVVVIDECTQATEPRATIAMARARGPVILVGDQNQLPPTCISQTAQRCGLGVSLFDRLTEEGCLKPLMLTKQYRMHPLLREFPSSAFYDSRLTDATCVKSRGPPSGFAWPNGQPLAFIDVGNGNEEVQGGDGASWRNPAEVRVVRRLVNDFLVAGMSPAHLGVISPYQAQVKDLVRSVPRNVEVKTIDGYQGREKELVILSCVRSNRNGRLGFLSDFRRLNVAITRPKCGLIVVGNADTLQHDPVWSSYLHFFRERHLFASLGGPKPGTKEDALPIVIDNGPASPKTQIHRQQDAVSLDFFTGHGTGSEYRAVSGAGFW